MRKLATIALLGVLVFPAMSEAAWWKPSDWFIKTIPVETVETVPQTPIQTTEKVVETLIEKVIVEKPVEKIVYVTDPALVQQIQDLYTEIALLKKENQKLAEKPETKECSVSVKGSTTSPVLYGRSGENLDPFMLYATAESNCPLFDKTFTAQIQQEGSKSALTVPMVSQNPVVRNGDVWSVSAESKLPYQRISVNDVAKVHVVITYENGVDVGTDEFDYHVKLIQ